jgi:hypothetical protein
MATSLKKYNGLSKIAQSKNNHQSCNPAKNPLLSMAYAKKKLILGPVL